VRQFRIICGDALAVLSGMPDESVNCCITSPPYWGLRDYGVPGQIGLESTPEEFVARLVAVFREVRRVLRADGTVWVNLGDSYASQGGQQVAQTKWQVNGASDGQNGGKSRTPPIGLKPKDLCGIPWRVAFALQADGWYLRQDLIWHKPNPMPESVTDRCTKAHEYIFLLSKNQRYFYDADAIAEASTKELDCSRGPKIYGDGGYHRNGKGASTLGPGRSEGRNRRSVWTVATEPFSGAHFACFPQKLIRPCVLAGCPVGGIVLDPFAGSGTAGVVALGLDREFIGIELNESYCQMARRRITSDAPLFNVEADPLPPAEPEPQWEQMALRVK
jgi:DNA modification methylase